MSLTPCSYCRQRPPEKLAQVTWAWNPRPHERLAYRQTLCLNCFCGHVLALDKLFEPEGRLCCPACGIDTEHAMDPVYVTAYVPGTGKMTYEFALCGACAVEVRVRAQTNAELLPDRLPESRGLATGNSPGVSAWDRLGIRPRDE